MILQNKALLGIANIVPTDARTLSMIPYFGEKGLKKYGEEILEMVQTYAKSKNIPIDQPSLFGENKKSSK